MDKGIYIVAAFDFDGTLTTADTFLSFISFTHGRRQLLLGLLRYAHLLVMMKLGLYPNGKAKEQVFSHFYKGVRYEQFKRWGRDFAVVAQTLLNKQTVEALQNHLRAGDIVCVVTASIDEWVCPICEHLGVNTLIATRIAVSPDGILTGRFQSSNCYGNQKVIRFLEKFPRRQHYQLYAYGDSRGDKELFEEADKAILVNHTHSELSTIYRLSDIYRK